MNKVRKRILIVSFSMPPSPNIGGRRWAKFAKCLKNNGHLVKIVAAKEPMSEISPWEEDVKCLHGDIQYISSGYPSYLGLRPETIKEKIFYRISLSYMKMVNAGNYYDKSNLWHNTLLRAVRENIIIYNLNNVICTVPPFRMAHTLLELKKEFPKVNFIVDFRDPWTNNQTAFGFTALPQKRFNYDLELERQVIRNYTKITAVSEQMSDYFRNFISTQELSQKFSCVPNGYDLDDFKNFSTAEQNGKLGEAIKFVFAGTFYDRSIHLLEQLAGTIQALSQKVPGGRERIKFIFAGSAPEEVRTLIKSHEPYFTYIGRKGLKETYELMASADYCTLFLTDDLNYSQSTKFYEYIALKKPIVSFSKIKGANAQFIERHQLGIGVDFEGLNQFVESAMNNTLHIPFNSTVDFSEYEVNTLVKKVERILIY